MARNTLTVTINGKQFVTKPANEATASISKIGLAAEKANKLAKIAFAGVAVAAAGAVAGLVIMVKQTTEAGDRIDKLSQQLGLSRKAFQQWDYVMTQTGTEIDSLKTGTKALWLALEQAERGSEKYASTLNTLGIVIKDSNGEYRDREAIFKDVLLALSDVNNETERTILANNLLGRSALQLSPLFNSGTEAIKEMIVQAETLGLIMSDSAIDAAVRWKDSIDRIKRIFNTFKNEAVTPVMELFANVADTVLPIIAEKLLIIRDRMKEATDPEGLNSMSDTVSKMLLNAITFAEFFPKIMQAAISDIKASWDDVFSGAQFERKMNVFSVKLAEVVNSFVSMIGLAISGTFQIITETLNNLIGNFLNGIFVGFSFLANSVASLVNKAINPIINLVNKVLNKDIATDILKPTASLKIPTFNLGDTIDKFNNDWESATTRFLDALEGRSADDESFIVIDTVTQLLGQLESALSDNTVAVENSIPPTSSTGGTDEPTETEEEQQSGFNNFLTSIMDAVSSLDSLKAILDPITTIFSGVMEVLGPAIDQLLAPLVGILKVLGNLIGSLLVPVIQLLAPIIEAVAKIFIWLYNKILLPVGNGIIRVFKIVQNQLISIINAVIKGINWALGWLGVNISEMEKVDINSGQLQAIDMTTLSQSGGISGSTYAGSTNGSSSSIQSVNITVNQYFEGNVIGDGGMEQVGEFVTKAIQSYTGVGGNVSLVPA